MPRASTTALLAAALAPGVEPFVVPNKRRRPPLRLNAGPAELWSGYLAALEADPLPVKMATAACVIGAGDATAQLIENERKKLPDAARVARWAFFGLVLQAPAFTALVFIFFAVLEGSGFRGGVAACERDLAPTILKNWLVFVPATFINLGFVPLELRVLFINVVFFFWVIFLSLLINNDEASKQV